MFKLSRAMQAIDQALGTQVNPVASWNTPVTYDPNLVPQLVAQYDELSAQFAALCQHLDGGNPAFAERSVLECADRLHKLRHHESLKLYPVISRGLSTDPIARRLFWQSRLVTLGLARRVLRRFDELARAIRNRSEIGLAAEHVTSALAEYRRRNEAAMFPLYHAVGARELVRAKRA